jgi:hypothetical protein
MISLTISRVPIPSGRNKKRNKGKKHIERKEERKKKRESVSDLRVSTR